MGAIICLVELIGPCRFKHWNQGKPVATDNPAAWVQMAAVSFEQNKNTFLLLSGYVPNKTRREFGMEIGKEKVRSHDGRRLLEAITSASRSSEGNRPSFFLANETHHWTSANGGWAMWDVVERNAAKSKGGQTRTLAITNAYMPGEESIAEITRRAYLKTVTIDPTTGRPYHADFGMLYDSLEAPPNAPLTPEIAPMVLEKVRGDAIWLDIETIVKSLSDPRNPPSRSRRFWYNQITADEEALVRPEEWENIRVKAQLYDGEEIVLGFDGGKTDDATALVAIRIADRCIFPLGIWEKPKASPHGWEVNRDRVDDVLASAFARFKVRAFFSDVSQWESYVDKWSNQYRDKLLIKAEPGKSAVGFDMRGHQEEITKGNERLVASIIDGGVAQNGHELLREHVMNTRSRVNKYGMTFDKIGGPESSRKNDGYAATLLAYLALNKYLESGKRPDRERTGEFWMF